MSDWQPIATARKDDAEIIVAYRRGESWFVSVAYWLPASGRWYEYGTDALLFPTHWMPLPAPPKADD